MIKKILKTVKFGQLSAMNREGSPKLARLNYVLIRTKEIVTRIRSNVVYIYLYCNNFGSATLLILCVDAKKIFTVT